MPEGEAQDANLDGQQFNVEHSESDQQVRAPEADVAPVEIVTPETGLADKPDGGEWDPELVKASVMGDVLTSDQNMKNDLIDYHAEKFSADSLEVIKTERLDEYNGRRKYEFKEPVEKLPDDIAIDLDRQITRDKEWSYEDANKQLEPFEELYDANRERFTNMPVSEFVVLAHELGLETRSLENIGKEEKTTTAQIETLAKALEDKKPLTVAYIRDIARGYASGAGWLASRGEVRPHSRGALAHADEREFFRIVGTDHFDKTPRQVNEEITALFRKQLDELAELRTERESRKQAIISGEEQAT